MRVLFFGTGEIGLPSLRGLADHGHGIVGVVTQPDRPAGRDLKPKPSAIKQEAVARGWPVFQPGKLRTDPCLEQLAGLGADIGVVAAYGQILPARVLSMPRFGCVNIHASRLPLHRGASPIQAAILSGASSTAVTIMAMDEGLDTGDILLVEPVEIQPGDTAGALHDRLAAAAVSPLIRVLQEIETGTVERTPQDHRLATYAPRLQKGDGAIDWTKSAEEVERHIRAMSPWPGAFSTLGGVGVLRIHRARLHPATGAAGEVLAHEPDGPLVTCGTGSVVLTELQAESRRRLSGADFLRGTPLAKGLRFSSPERAN
ncbi:MAG: methionyl-tRNA formyltransferase [Terrimicrobiaceae bacterium]|nr:methionyl-tRNA formyltransferase [Terrimicrobiaceae bacterium]